MPWTTRLHDTDGLPLVMAPEVTTTEPSAPSRVDHDGTNAWTWPVSVLAHGIALAAVASVTPPALITPPVRSIAVQIISREEYERVMQPPPAPRMMPPDAAAMAPVPGSARVAAPSPSPSFPPASGPPEVASSGNGPDGMITAEVLFAGDILKDPQFREVAETLPLLETTERVTQLCNIEALEQLRLLHPDTAPDSLDPSAMAPTSVVGNTLQATGGAYRMDRRWYEVSLVCTVADDYLSVMALEFSPGSPIPREQWESHNLIDEDLEFD